jgi:hypothetical protein
MLHLLAIIVGSGAHVAFVHLVAFRSFGDVLLAAEIELIELVDDSERNEDTVSHGLAEALVTMEHLAHTVGG